MSVQEVPMFTVFCDGCGSNADEGSDYAGWSDKETAVEIAKDGAEYREIEGKHFCPECVEVDEETDEWKPVLKVVK